MTTSGLSSATGPADLEQLYRDLHASPELSQQEHRTAALVADQLAAAGFEVTTNIGGTGVAGVIANGAGPTALVRADEAMSCLLRADPSRHMPMEKVMATLTAWKFDTGFTDLVLARIHH
jgi:hypothetical protein